MGLFYLTGSNSGPRGSALFMVVQGHTTISRRLIDDFRPDFYPTFKKRYPVTKIGDDKHFAVSTSPQYSTEFRGIVTLGCGTVTIVPQLRDNYVIQCSSLSIAFSEVVFPRLDNTKCPFDVEIDLEAFLGFTCFSGKTFCMISAA